MMAPWALLPNNDVSERGVQIRLNMFTRTAVLGFRHTAVGLTASVCIAGACKWIFVTVVTSLRERWVMVHGTGIWSWLTTRGSSSTRLCSLCRSVEVECDAKCRFGTVCTFESLDINPLDTCLAEIPQHMLVQISNSVNSRKNNWYII